MALSTFKGGVHPTDGKELSKDKPVRELLPKGELVYPLSQHIGAPAVPIVTVGDSVLRGQMIAEAGGFVSAPVYSSVSGTVKSIEQRRVAVGDMVESIIIENDGEYNEVEFEEILDINLLSNEEIIDKIKLAGIVGMGGAGFPTHIKLTPKEPEKIEYIIANCAECEPYLTSDYRRMVEEPEKLVEGMNVILQLFPKAKGIFAIENNKPKAIEKLRKLTRSDHRMQVVELETKYPQGGERQLIYAATKRYINSKMLPADAGCIVDNVETIVAIYQAVMFGKPVMNRIFTVTGNAVTDPCNFYVHLGTNFQEILEAAGGLNGDCEKAIAGGPMMGFALFGLNIPTTKTTSALLCFTEDEVSRFEPSACINCGRCGEVCPERLIPTKLSDMSERNQPDLFEKWYGLECVECGSCSFICPANKQLAQSIKIMKKKVLVAKRKK
ncbi:MAG: electron transport complex subunit RsxC [Lachnospiraceae bacterium]